MLLMIFKLLLYLQSCPLSNPNIFYLGFLFFSSLVNQTKVYLLLCFLKKQVLFLLIFSFFCIYSLFLFLISFLLLSLGLLCCSLPIFFFKQKMLSLLIYSLLHSRLYISLNYSFYWIPAHTSPPLTEDPYTHLT